MPKYYHVTKLAKVSDIKTFGLRVSSGLAAGGMSADSSEASKYAEQDRGLVYLWTDIDYTDRFKKDGEKYALIVADVTAAFDLEHIDVTTAAKKLGKTKADDPAPSTVVSDATIARDRLYYYDKDPKHGGQLKQLISWGAFSMELDGRDDAIWAGLED